MPHPDASNSVSADRNRRPGLDALRLVAALAVVAHHGLFRGPHSEWGGGVRFPGLEDVAVYGCLGVDLFFVISGYVIAWSSEGRGATAFARARILRLWPGFVFCMSLTTIVLALVHNSSFPVSGPQWLANLVLVPQLFHQPFIDGAYWTIVAELTFYVWIFLAIVTRVFPRYTISLGWLWLTITVVNHVWLQSGLIKHLFLTNFSGEFLGGVLLFRMARHRSDVATLALLAASVATSIWFGSVSEIRDFQLGLGYAMDPLVMRVITLSAFGLVAAASQIRVNGRAANIVFIAGGLTYPTYLLHQNIEYVLAPKLIALGVSPLLAFLSVAAGVLIIAFFIFRCIEPIGKAWLARPIDAALRLAASVPRPSLSRDRLEYGVFRGGPPP